MKIFLAPVAGATPATAIPEFEELASHAIRHELTSRPDEADICLFVDCHVLGDPITLTRIYRSGTFRRFREKCYVYDQRPRAYCSMPGLFVSVPRWALRPTYQIPWAYYRLKDPRRFLDDGFSTDVEPDLLFSFVGAAQSHPSRASLLAIDHPRALMKQVEGHVNWEPNQPGYNQRRKEFVNTILRSKFVLCPRGRATSSIRFYETMACGRVPVVIGDDWVAPKGLNLESFAIRWPEKSPDKLAGYLESREDEAESMGREAMRLYDSYFAPEVAFDRIGDLLCYLAATDPWAHFPRFGFPPDRRVVRHIFGRARKLARQYR